MFIRLELRISYVNCKVYICPNKITSELYIRPEQSLSVLPRKLANFFTILRDCQHYFQGNLNPYAKMAMSDLKVLFN